MREPGEISFECDDCGATHIADYGEEETNDDGEPICGECAKPPTWDDMGFPIWLDYEFYEDNFGLLRTLEEAVDVPYENFPDHIKESGSDFKYTVERFWYKVDEDGNVEGPYGEKRGEKI